MDKKHIQIIIVIAVLIALVVFFFPKERVVGGLRGFIDKSDVAYKEEYDCIGIAHDFCPNWPDYGCDLQCYGMTFNKKCYNEFIGADNKITKTEATCKT